MVYPDLFRNSWTTLNLVQHFNLLFFLGYLLIATLTQTLAVYLSSRMMKFDRLTSFNLGIAINNRGGPGIVLSSVAYSTGIINQDLFAILVMLALVTSWFPGTWRSAFVLQKGWKLMPGDEKLASTQKQDKKNVKTIH